MCFPMAIPVAMAAMTGFQILGERKAAKSQLAAQEAAAKSAFRNANAQQNALQTQANLAQSQAAERLTAQQLEAAQAASAARVSAGEAGVTGVGVNRIVGDVGAQLATETAITQRNLTTQQQNIAAQQETVQSGLESQIKQFQTPVAMPGLLDSVARIGMSFVGGMGTASALGLGGAGAAAGAGAVSPLAQAGAVAPSVAAPVASESFNLGTLLSGAFGGAQVLSPGASSAIGSQRPETAFQEDVLESQRRRTGILQDRINLFK